MKFGVCIPIQQAPVAAAAGWDFVEEIVTNFLSADLADADWHGAELARKSPLPVPVANRLVPAHLKITGPNVDPAALRRYMEIIVKRAQASGIRLLVFGSGPARSVPEGFDRGVARRQILDFCRMAASLCENHGIVLLAEPMNRGESNIMNSVYESMEFVREVNCQNFRCLVDTFHLWLENEPIAEIEMAMPWIAHVHVSDVSGRRAPGETGKHDYRPLFAALQRGKYDGLITVESNDLAQLPDGAGRVLSFLKNQWHEALQEKPS